MRKVCRKCPFVVVRELSSSTLSLFTFSALAVLLSPIGDLKSQTLLNTKRKGSLCKLCRPLQNHHFPGEFSILKIAFWAILKSQQPLDFPWLFFWVKVFCQCVFYVWSKKAYGGHSSTKPPSVFVIVSNPPYFWDPVFFWKRGNKSNNFTLESVRVKWCR